MDSLSSGLVAEVLQRLHQEAEAADAPLMQTFESEATNLEQAMSQVVEAETKDLTGLYHGYADNFLSVSPQFGRFLYMCARSCKAKRIVEFGSSMGISAIYMAAALRDMGGGVLIGTELNPARPSGRRRTSTAAGLADLVEFRVGDARETLKAGVGGDIDMVMLDGAFTLYLPDAQAAGAQSEARRDHHRRECVRASRRLHRLRPRSSERLSLAAAVVRSGARQRIHGQDEVIRAVATRSFGEEPRQWGKLCAASPRRVESTRTLLRWLMRPARVAAVETLSPHFRLVDLEGEALRNVAWTAGQKLQVAMGSGLSARTYTPMSWDADSGRTRMLTFAQATVPAADGPAACAKATPASSSVRAARSIYPAPIRQSPVVLFGDETSFGLAAALRECPQGDGAIHVFEASDVAESRPVRRRSASAKRR